MKIGFIGMGHMAQALVRGWNATRQQEAEEILAYAPHRKKLLDNAARLGFTAADSPRDLVAASDLVIMACKPYQVESVLSETADLLQEKPLLSIALGWDFARYHSVLGSAQRVRYVMPSTPAEVGEGVFLLEDVHSLTEEEEEVSRLLFAGIGKVMVMPSHLMGIAGTISGCGPAFADMIIEVCAGQPDAARRGQAAARYRPPSGGTQGRGVLARRQHDPRRHGAGGARPAGGVPGGGGCGDGL